MSVHSLLFGYGRQLPGPRRSGAATASPSACVTASSAEILTSEEISREEGVDAGADFRVEGRGSCHWIDGDAP